MLDSASIKARRIINQDKLGNARRELAVLEELAADASLVGSKLETLTEQLGLVNARLWDIEDMIRIRERKGDFGSEFVALVRSV